MNSARREHRLDIGKQVLRLPCQDTGELIVIIHAHGHGTSGAIKTGTDSRINVRDQAVLEGTHKRVLE
jgi:hypothetical protein